MSILFKYSKKEDILSDVEMRNELINAASGVFAKYGYKKTNMDDIAAVFGKGKTFIYYYFKNKEDIFQAVLTDEADKLLKALSETAESESLPEKKLKKFVLVWANTLMELDNYYQIIKTEYFSNKDFFKTLREKIDEKQHEILTSIFREGTASGRFKKLDPEWVASTFFTAMKGFELPLLKRKSFEDIETRIDDLLNLLLNGLLA